MVAEYSSMPPNTTTLTAHLLLSAGAPLHTRSQCRYMKLTGLSFDAFTIWTDLKYYLFIDMRNENKWASFRLTS